MKNTVTYFLLLPFTCSLSLIACYSPRYVYSPTATNVPAFSKKGDSKLAAYYSNSAFSGRDVKKYYGYGFDAQFACAVHDNWLVLLNQSYRYEKNSGNLATDNTGSNFIRYKRSMTEIGGGFFRVVKDSSKLFVQLTGGIGVGKFLLDDNGKDAANQYYNRHHQTGVTKLFIQPALQLRYNKYFNTSFASRFVILWYHSIKTDYTAAEQNAYLLDGLNTSPRTFWEPAVINSFSFKKMPAVQFEIQFGFAALISRRFIDYRSVNISAGAVVDIFKLGKKQR